MDIEDLINLVETNSNRKEISHLLCAISDWPYNICSIEEYFLAVKAFLSIGKIDVLKIKERINCFNLLDNIWELESISELILFLEYYNLDNLDDLDLQKYY